MLHSLVILAVCHMNTRQIVGKHILCRSDRCSRYKDEFLT